MTTSKSPRMVATEALAVGTKALPLFSHRYSPKVYTQPQLFACLALKAFFKTDYRGIVEILRDCRDLVSALGLKDVPHFTTLQKACARLLCLAFVKALLDATVRRFLRRRRTPAARAALAWRGFDCGPASRYYVRRRAKGGASRQRTTYKRF